MHGNPTFRLDYSGFNTEDTNQAEESSNGKSESDDDEMYGDSNSGLTNDDKVVLKSVFKKCISHGQKLSMHEFRHQMRSDPYLRRSVTDKTKVKKMYDFVRAKTKKESHLKEIEVDEFEFDGVKTVPSSLTRRQWSEDDEKCIEERFAKHDQMPIKSAVLAIFRQDPVLQYVLENEGKERCYEKVKNLYKKKAVRPKFTNVKKR